MSRALLLALCLATITGCLRSSLPLTPSPTVIWAYKPVPIPLSVALYLPPEHVQTRYEGNHGTAQRICRPVWVDVRLQIGQTRADYTSNPCAPPYVQVNVGQASVGLFRKHLAALFTSVTEVQVPALSDSTELLLVPRIEEVNAVGWSDRIQASVTYDLEIITRAGTRHQIRHSATGEHQSRWSGIDWIIWPTYVADWLLTGTATVTTVKYAKAFAVAEGEAFYGLAQRLRASTVVAQVLDEATLDREEAALSEDEKDIQRQLDRLVAILLRGLPHGRPRHIAVLPLRAAVGQATQLETYVSEGIRTRVGRASPHHMVERELLRAALDELKLNQSDLFDREQAKVLGRLVAADALVVGTATDIGHWIMIRARMVETQTNAVLTSSEMRIFKTAQVRALMTVEGAPRKDGAPELVRR